MNLIDTHTHLYSEQLIEDLPEILERAKQQNVTRFLLPAIDKSYYDKMIEVKKNYPKDVFLMMGLHPCSVSKETYKEELDFVYKELKTGAYVAVGEIGIDLYWDQSTLKEQQEAFHTQISWAQEFDLPINIHCRDAFDEVFEVLSTFNQKISGVFHCFTGTQAQAEQAIDFGLKLGIGGVATFKNGKIDKFLKNIPLEHIVLETDAPYLAPTPYRGKRNEPSYVKLVAEKLAEIYELPLAVIADKTTKNTLDVFKLD